MALKRTYHLYRARRVCSLLMKFSWYICTYMPNCSLTSARDNICRTECCLTLLLVKLFCQSWSAQKAAMGSPRTPAAIFARPGGGVRHRRSNRLSWLISPSIVCLNILSEGSKAFDWDNGLFSIHLRLTYMNLLVCNVCLNSKDCLKIPWTSTFLLIHMFFIRMCL